MASTRAAKPTTSTAPRRTSRPATPARPRTVSTPAPAWTTVDQGSTGRYGTYVGIASYTHPRQIRGGIQLDRLTLRFSTGTRTYNNVAVPRMNGGACMFSVADLAGDRRYAAEIESLNC